MAESRESGLLARIWRHKWLVVAVMDAAIVAALVVVTQMEPVYASTSKLLVAQPEQATTPDADQPAHRIAQTYAQLAAAQEIRTSAGRRFGLTPEQVDRAVDVTLVPDTEVLAITAQARSASRAQQLADAYARAFIAYDQATLRPVTHASLIVAARAEAPDAPIRPRPVLYGAIAAAIGLILGLGVALARDRLDKRFRSADHLQSELAIPVLARIPDRRDVGANADTTEAYRLLWVQLRYALDPANDRPSRAPLFVVTSVGPREGKTTTVAQLGRVAASVGTEALLVEGDPFSRRLTRGFSLQNGTLEPGLVEYLKGEATLTEVRQATELPGVSVIPFGDPTQSLSQVLDLPDARYALDALGVAAEVVFIDCPPIQGRADAAALAPQADDVILVADLARSDRRLARQALNRLTTVGGHVVGVVVNRDRSDDLVAYGARAERQRTPVRG